MLATDANPRFHARYTFWGPDALIKNFAYRLASQLNLLGCGDESDGGANLGHVAVLNKDLGEVAVCGRRVRAGATWRNGALSKDEGQKVLRGMTIDRVKKFADRWGYGRDEVISWAMGYSEIHGGALWALGDRDEMAKITGETR